MSPRGERTRELENFSVTLPPRVRWLNFRARKLNLVYVRREFRWYLRGNPRDLSIAKVAKLWDGIVSRDGSVNSNYGQYLVQEGGLHWVVQELRRDPDSRRACVMILSNQHLSLRTETFKDVPCTYALNFRIREGKLNMSVHMRSQDAIFGMGNDLPCFSFFHELVGKLMGRELGAYHHCVDSLHVYERHWKMLDAILDEPDPWAGDIHVPEMLNAHEARLLLSSSPRSSSYPFTDWLYADHAQPEEPFP